MLFRPLCLLASLASVVLADVKFTTPTPGGKVSNSQLTVDWEDGGGTTPLSQLAGWQLFLVAGGATDATTQVVGTASGDHSTGALTATIEITAPAAGPKSDTSQNAYYLRMISSGKTGGQVFNYSPRFTVSGMTGDWKPASLEQDYKAAIAQSPTGSVPATLNQISSNQNNPGAGGAGGPEYSVPYQMQTTGLTKYAPMQQHAPTAITKQDVDRLFPTSLFIVASTALPTATQVTTMTAKITYSYATRVNTATAAPPPDDMQKFLNRWKD